MTKYVRYDAPPEFRLRYHFRDKFNNDIIGAREYDPETGEGKALAYPGASEEPDMLIPFFKPQGYVEIDGHVNPSPETLEKLFATAQENNSKTVVSPTELDTTVKMSEQDVTYREKISERK